MSRRLLLAWFETEEDILDATRDVRAQGLRIVDVWSPYPVHRLDVAMGLRPSRLPFFCFVLGLVGAALKMWFEYWTTAVDWPLNVGGKPWDSLPAFVPVTFEVMVLSAGLTTVAAFFVAARLRPGKQPVTPDERATDDRFVLVLEETDSTFDAARVEERLRRFHALEVEERIVGEHERMVEEAERIAGEADEEEGTPRAAAAVGAAVRAATGAAAAQEERHMQRGAR